MLNQRTFRSALYYFESRLTISVLDRAKQRSAPVLPDWRGSAQLKTVILLQLSSTFNAFQHAAVRTTQRHWVGEQWLCTFEMSLRLRNVRFSGSRLGRPVRS